MSNQTNNNLSIDRIGLYANDKRMCNVNDEIREMARRLLAAEAELQEYRKASSEPVAYIFKHPAGKLFWSLTDESNKDRDDVFPVHSVPPAPVSVPDVISITRAKDKVINPNNAEAFSQGWNACRSAMLRGADGTLINEGTKRVGELVMWVKRLAHSIRKANPDSKLQSDAMDYLSRNGLISVKDVLR